MNNIQRNKILLKHTFFQYLNAHMCKAKKKNYELHNFQIKCLTLLNTSYILSFSEIVTRILYIVPLVIVFKLFKFSPNFAQIILLIEPNLLFSLRLSTDGYLQQSAVIPPWDSLLNPPWNRSLGAFWQ